MCLMWQEEEDNGGESQEDPEGGMQTGETQRKKGLIHTSQVHTHIVVMRDIKTESRMYQSGPGEMAESRVFQSGAGEMAQQGRGLDVLAEHLSLVYSIHTGHSYVP